MKINELVDHDNTTKNLSKFFLFLTNREVAGTFVFPRVNTSIRII